MPKKKFWTEEKLHQLKQMYKEGKTDFDIAKSLGVSANSVAYQRRINGWVKYNFHPNHWTEEEIDRLKKFPQSYSYAEIGRIMKRSPNSVRDKAHQLNLNFSGNNYVRDTLGKEYREMGDGPIRGYTTGSNLLIVQYLSEGFPLSFIAQETKRDYNDLKQHCIQNFQDLLKAHIIMIKQDGIYAYRIRKMEKSGTEWLRKIVEEESVSKNA